MDLSTTCQCVPDGFAVTAEKNRTRRLLSRISWFFLVLAVLAAIAAIFAVNSDEAGSDEAAVVIILGPALGNLVVGITFQVIANCLQPWKPALTPVLD